MANVGRKVANLKQEWKGVGWSAASTTFHRVLSPVRSISASVFFPNEIKTRFFFGRVPSHPFRKFIFPTAISQIPSASVWLDRMEDPSGRKRKKGNSLLLICVLTRSFCWRSTIPWGHTRPNVLPPIHSFTEDVTAGNKTHTRPCLFCLRVAARRTENLGQQRGRMARRMFKTFSRWSNMVSVLCDVCVCVLFDGELETVGEVNAPVR